MKIAGIDHHYLDIEWLTSILSASLKPSIANLAAE